jgi:hypothetical protein
MRGYCGWTVPRMTGMTDRGRGKIRPRRHGFSMRARRARDGCGADGRGARRKGIGMVTARDLHRWIRAGRMASSWRPRGARPMNGGSTAGIELAPDTAPSPPAPLPRCAGERGEFDPYSKGIELASAGGPSPDPSPRKLRAERGEFDRATTGFLPFSLPHAVCGGGPGRGAPADASPGPFEARRSVGIPEPPPAVSGEVRAQASGGGVRTPARSRLRCAPVSAYARCGSGRSHRTRRVRQASSRATTTSDTTRPAQIPCAPAGV